MEDRITMSRKEFNRLEVIRRVVYEGLTQVKAAEYLGISDRQVRRLIKRYRTEGTNGVISRRAGRCGTKGYKSSFKQDVVSLIRDLYPDFGPTLAAEKLQERHDM